MRRASLLVAAALPAIAAADIPAGNGQLLDYLNYSAVLTQQASFVNLAMCEGRDTLHLEWNLGSQPVQTGTYTLFASNTAPPTSGADANFCATQNDPNGTTRAGQVTGGSGQQVNAVQRNTTVTGASAVTPANLICGSASENQVFYICAHFFVGSTRTASAIGKFVVQVASPAPPTNVGVGSGPSQLSVSWNFSSTSGATPADHYIASATPVDASGAAIGPAVSSASVTGGSVTISGLTDGQEYRVSVTAYSVGGNPSEPAVADQLGVPQAADGFWEIYKGAGGVEQGGCGTGGAGPVALVATAGLLAVLRRRK